MELIKKEDLKTRGIYEIKSRNLSYGVYDGENGFIGIREKLGSKYLFTEYLCREAGGSQNGFDTVRPIRFVALLSKIIPLQETLGSKCGDCNKPARWIESPKSLSGWECDGGCEKVIAYSVLNKPLYEVLQQVEELDNREESDEKN